MGDSDGFTRESVTWTCEKCRSEVTVRSRGMSDVLKRMPIGWKDGGKLCPYCDAEDAYKVWERLRGD